VLKLDFDYWGIDEMMLEPCCALKYYPEMEVCSKEQEGEKKSKIRMQVRKVKFKAQSNKNSSCFMKEPLKH